jgi:hypothetical protein
MNSLSSTSWRRQRLARLEAEQEDVLGNVMSNVRGEREGRGVAERVAAGKTGGFRDPEFCLVVLVVHSSAGGWQLFLKKTLMIAKKKKKKKNAILNFPQPKYLRPAHGHPRDRGPARAPTNCRAGQVAFS